MPVPSSSAAVQGMIARKYVIGRLMVPELVIKELVHAQR